MRTLREVFSHNRYYIIIVIDTHGNGVYIHEKYNLNKNVVPCINIRRIRFLDFDGF